MDSTREYSSRRTRAAAATERSREVDMVGLEAIHGGMLYARVQSRKERGKEMGEVASLALIKDGLTVERTEEQCGGEQHCIRT